MLVTNQVDNKEVFLITKEEWELFKHRMDNLLQDLPTVKTLQIKKEVKILMYGNNLCSTANKI